MPPTANARNAEGPLGEARLYVGLFDFEVYVAESDRFIESGGFSLLPETMPISCALTVRIFFFFFFKSDIFERVMV